MSSRIIAKYTKHISNMRLESHIVFICPECAEELETQQDWRNHLNESHGYKDKTAEDFNFKEIDESYHECQTCLKLVANANQTIVLLQYHYFLHLPFNRTYRCRHCMVKFRRKRALVVHLCRVHSNLVGVIPNLELPNKNECDGYTNGNPDFYIRFICPQCGMLFAKQDLWKEHLKVSHVSTYTELRMHKISVSNNHYCLDCKKTFHTSDREKLQRHHFTHLPYKLYMQCAYCSYKRPYKSEILRHFIYVHTKEFLSVKPYIRKPDEFGAKINARLDFELGVLLSKEDENDERFDKRPQSDLIRRALMSTFLENGNKQIVNVNSHNKNQGENILTSGLHDSDNFMKVETVKETELNDTEDINFDSDELEELCNDVFESIDADCHESIGIIKVVDSTDNKKIPIPPINNNKNLEIVPKEYSTENIEEYIVYLCPQCGIDFNQQTSWRQHVFEAHDLSNIVESKFKKLNKENSFLCVECKEVLSTQKPSELQRHYFNHMPFHSYLKCTICNKTKSSKSKFLHHFKEKHAYLRSDPIKPLPKVSSMVENTRLLIRSKSVSLRLNRIFQKYDRRNMQ